MAIRFDKRFNDRWFTKWKGGRYRFYLETHEIEFYTWIFENGLEKEIKFTFDQNAGWSAQSHNPYFINFKTGEAFVAFKLAWL